MKRPLISDSGKESVSTARERAGDFRVTLLHQDVSRMVKIVLPLKVVRMVEKQTRHVGSLVVEPTTSHIALKILG